MDDRELTETTDSEAEQRATWLTLERARAEGLTPYDAAYLELAVCRQLPPAT